MPVAVHWREAHAWHVTRITLVCCASVFSHLARLHKRHWKRSSPSVHVPWCSCVFTCLVLGCWWRHVTLSDTFGMLLLRPPQLELKNAIGLSNDSLQNLQTELNKLALASCGEVSFRFGPVGHLPEQPRLWVMVALHQKWQILWVLHVNNWLEITAPKLNWFYAVHVTDTLWGSSQSTSRRRLDPYP